MIPVEPPDFVDATGRVLGWYINPTGVIHIHLGPHFGADGSNFLATTLNAGVHAFRNARGEVDATYIFDWSRIRSHDSATRSAMVKWGLSIRPNVKKLWILLGPGVPALSRMAAVAGAMAVQVAGMQIAIVDSEDQLLEFSVVPRNDPARRALP